LNGLIFSNIQQYSAVARISNLPKYYVVVPTIMPLHPYSLSAAPVAKLDEIFVSRFDPQVNASQIKD